MARRQRVVVERGVHHVDNRVASGGLSGELP